MNYGELKQLVADYMHRGDLTAQLPGFVQFAHARIMRDVRVPGMLTDATLSMASNPQALPSDFLDMRELSGSNGSSRYNLRSVGRSQLNRYTAATGGLPQVYSIIGNSVEVQPTTAEDLRIIYFASIPFFSGDTATNTILTNYPYLYLYASLVEANSYIQDAEQREKSINFYLTEVDKVNAEATETRYGEAPQIGVA
jgi:hypothetical protein